MLSTTSAFCNVLSLVFPEERTCVEKILIKALSICTPNFSNLVEYRLHLEDKYQLFIKLVFNYRKARIFSNFMIKEVAMSTAPMIMKVTDINAVPAAIC